MIFITSARPERRLLKYSFEHIYQTALFVSAIAMSRRRTIHQRRAQYFVADRPFFYLLTARQVPLFMGIYGGHEYAVSRFRCNML